MFSTILLQLIVFFLPTQLGLHFWSDFARAAGIKVDYLSPTLYFVDILLILYLGQNLKLLAKWLVQQHRTVWIFLLFILLNTGFSISPLGSVYWWSRNLLYLLFFLTLRLQKTNWSQIKTPLFFSALLVVFLETVQFSTQHSVDGLFYWLGERAYSSSTSNVGRLSLFGLDIVRPQSTFSHPNSLAGYLLLVYYLMQIYRSPLWQRITLFLGLVLTFSKSALLAFLLVNIFKLSSLPLIILFMAISAIQVFLSESPRLYQFVSDRIFFFAPTGKMITAHPIIGVGLGGYIPSLAKIVPGSFLIHAKLQPVHNTILLAISEVGVLGLGLCLVIIKKNLKKLLRPQTLGLLALLIITGAFDHYWWTLPQNKLILLLAAAVLL